MRREPGLYLNDILESIDAIANYLKGVDRLAFLANGMMMDAVQKRLEVMGEAVKGLDAQLKARHPEVPWQRIAGMRDVLSHGYFGVDMNRVWEVAVKDLPVLRAQVLKVTEEEGLEHRL
jgi:uncharacterized protein with HEPN domain